MTISYASHFLNINHISIYCISLVLFESGQTICFGDGSEGRLGNDNIDSIAGSGIALSLSPFISFSSLETRVSSLALGGSFTCVLRCDGYVMCFGGNIKGQLGRGDVIPYGKTLGDMASLNPIPFSFALPSARCAALLMTMTESTGRLTGFSPYTTLYYLTVTNDISSFSLSTYSLSPAATATVAVNGVYSGLAQVDLSDARVNKVPRKHF